MAALTIALTAHDLIADDPAHFGACFRSEIVVMIVAGVDDLRRIDAVQPDVDVGVGEHDRVAVDDANGA